MMSLLKYMYVTKYRNKQWLLCRASDWTTKKDENITGTIIVM